MSEYLPDAEVVEELASFGIRAFTTARQAGSFGFHADEPVRDVMRRWAALRERLRAGGGRLATAAQVHGDRVVVHGTAWEGWLRVEAADGHVMTARGTAAAVSVADCVPVFIAHPSGATALLHSGWRGTAARIVEHGIAALGRHALAAADLRIHLGPAICGRCYEVSAEVHRRLTGRDPGRPSVVDLRAIIADHARATGVRHITTSPLCTRCDNGILFSHRAGDEGRQLAVMIADE